MAAFRVVRGGPEGARRHACAAAVLLRAVSMTVDSMSDYFIIGVTHAGRGVQIVSEK
jgi:hypothetical protein